MKFINFIQNDHEWKILFVIMIVLNNFIASKDELISEEIMASGTAS